jgi:hypothetical protein
MNPEQIINRRKQRERRDTPNPPGEVHLVPFSDGNAKGGTGVLLGLGFSLFNCSGWHIIAGVWGSFVITEGLLGGTVESARSFNLQLRLEWSVAKESYD